MLEVYAVCRTACKIDYSCSVTINFQNLVSFIKNEYFLLYSDFEYSKRTSSLLLITIYVEIKFS